ncbi:MAG: dethiobiotin synthase [Acidimicrobiales bacterium]|nr:dethiobiotin synthase [Acidimicrobiales bacterium]
MPGSNNQLTKGVRPRLLIAVVGTGTEVGKTWLVVELMQDFVSKRLKVSARKPAQSFGEGEPGRTDAELLAEATGESPYEVCSKEFWFETPLAPPMAAAELSLEPFFLMDLVGSISWTKESDIGIVELAGGIRSPQCEDADALGVVKAIEPNLVILVSDARLGAITSIRSALDSFKVEGYKPDHLIVFLNHFDEKENVQALNREWLSGKYEISVFTNVNELEGEIEKLLPF